MASTKQVATDKTAHCVCGEMKMDASGENKDPQTGLPYHKVTWDDVWFCKPDDPETPSKGLEVGSELTLTKVFPRHFKSSHGFMGQVIHKPSGTVFHIQSASADSAQRLMKEGTAPLYPNAKS